MRTTWSPGRTGSGLRGQPTAGFAHTSRLVTTQREDKAKPGRGRLNMPTNV